MKKLHENKWVCNTWGINISKIIENKYKTQYVHLMRSIHIRSTTKINNENLIREKTFVKP